jgi:hypothetical protein
MPISQLCQSPTSNVNKSMNNLVIRGLAILFLWCVAASCQAIDLEPRRWTHLPMGTNFGGGGYARTQGDIDLDPVLRAEDVEMDMDSWVFQYIRSFEFANKSASLSLTQAQHNAIWSGLLDGVPTSVHRVGLADPVLRLAIIIKGAPPLKGKDFLTYRGKQDIETIVGIGLAVQLPAGEYLDDKLLNFGSNRFTIRPQLGVVHNRGKWSMELTGAVWLYTDNNDFFNGNELEQDPTLVLQGHLIHNFRPGVWAGLSIGYAYGGESTINGIKKDDRKQDAGWALSYGIRLTPRISAKIGYVGSRAVTLTGLDSHSVAIGFSTYW